MDYTVSMSVSLHTIPLVWSVTAKSPEDIQEACEELVTSEQFLRYLQQSITRDVMSDATFVVEDYEE